MKSSKMAKATEREKLVKSITATVYKARKVRAEHPEGKIDKGGRWYPSEREDAGGDGSCTRSPTMTDLTWSYKRRCRTRQHCSVLVERALQGLDVPKDVSRVVGPVEIAAYRASPSSHHKGRQAESGLVYAIRTTGEAKRAVAAASVDSAAAAIVEMLLALPVPQQKQALAAAKARLFSKLDVVVQAAEVES